MYTVLNNQPVDFLGCRTNILDVEPRSESECVHCWIHLLILSMIEWIYGVAAFMFAAVAVILLQEYLGPAFFLPQNVCFSVIYYCQGILLVTGSTDGDGTDVRLSSFATITRPWVSRAILGRLRNLHGCHPCWARAARHSRLRSGEAGPSRFNEQEWCKEKL